MTNVSRAYLTTDSGRRVHYRRAGSGPPLVMLHPSHGSSWALEDLMRALASRQTTLAIDTPGYGESEPLAVELPTIEDYADALGETLDALGLAQIDLYGAHTGAKIAIAFALTRPDRVHRLVLDGLAIWTADEIADVVAHYTPSLTPEPDATHWVRAWAMVRNRHIFWPWYRRDWRSRIFADLPSPTALHAQFVDLIRAGSAYSLGYQAAFAYDGLAALRRVSVPTVLLASTADRLATHLERATGLAPNVTIAPPQNGLTARANRIAQALADDVLPPTPLFPPVVPVVGQVRRDYAPTRVGQVLLRRSGTGPGRPLLLFHGSPGTSRQLEPLLLAMGLDRPVITFDTPGLGDSSSPPPGAAMWDIAAIVGDAIDSLGLDEYDIYGSRTGSCLGIELAIARPDQVRRLIVDGPVIYSKAYAAWMVQHYLPLLTPQDHGGHLLLAWNFRRDQQLFYPWFDHTLAGVEARIAFTTDRDAAGLTGEALNRGFSDFLKSALTYQIPYHAGITYPTIDRLPLVDQPVLICTNEHDVFRPTMAEACQAARAYQSRIYPDPGPPEALAATIDLFRRFFDGEALPSLHGEL
ncbi:MAG: alpha/beta hydrolase [Dehalococcoidia bacterium]